MVLKQVLKIEGVNYSIVLLYLIISQVNYTHIIIIYIYTYQMTITVRYSLTRKVVTLAVFAVIFFIWCWTSAALAFATFARTMTTTVRCIICRRSTVINGSIGVVGIIVTTTVTVFTVIATVTGAHTTNQCTVSIALLGSLFITLTVQICIFIIFLCTPEL